jgi:chromosome partitioning protein
VLKLHSKYNDIIIETGGRDTSSQRAALVVADLALIPVVPRSFDVWALEKAAELVEEVRSVNPALQALAFINRADPRGLDNAQTGETIKALPALLFSDRMLGARKAFANAAAEGLAVTELKPEDERASAEMRELFDHVFSIQPRRPVAVRRRSQGGR